MSPYETTRLIAEVLAIVIAVAAILWAGGKRAGNVVGIVRENLEETKLTKDQITEAKVHLSQMNGSVNDHMKLDDARFASLETQLAELKGMVTALTAVLVSKGGP